MVIAASTVLGGNEDSRAASAGNQLGAGPGIKHSAWSCRLALANFHDTGAHVVQFCRNGSMRSAFSHEHHDCRVARRVQLAATPTAATPAVASSAPAWPIAHRGSRLDRLAPLVPPAPAS